MTTTDAAPVLELDGVTVRYRSAAGMLAAVRGASLAVGPREVLGIVGESGSGKSTLAQVMMGYRPTAAEVTADVARFRGRPLLDMSLRELRSLWGDQIAMVHQNALATLTPTMTVGDQIAETVRQHRRIGRDAARRVALDALAGVNVPDPVNVYHRYPHQLSGGQRQRVSIAIALSLEPALLILDEPTTALDVTTEAVILDLLRELKAATDIAMVYISHNLAVVGQIADRVAVMYAGEILEIGETSALFKAPSHPYTRALIDCLPTPGAEKRRARLRAISGDFPSSPELGPGCVFRDRCDRHVAACDGSPAWKEIAPSRSVRCFNRLPEGYDKTSEAVPATELVPGTEINLAAHEITKAFGGNRRGRATVAVDRASLEARRAEIVGLVGESGSGKTTLLRCIAGLTEFEGTSLSIGGISAAHTLGKRDRATLKQVQMVFQDPVSTLNPAVTVGENLVRHMRAFHKVGAAEAREVVVKAIQRVRLNGRYVDRYPNELSGGEKQRVAIARAFLAQPSLVLCDEPLSALDVSVQSSVVQLLLDLQTDTEATYILVSHDMSIVRYVADRIVVMYLGQVVDEGPAESFAEPPLHPYTEALLASVPTLETRDEARVLLERHISDVDRKAAGCVFAARCPRVIEGVCDSVAPPWRQAGTRRYQCHHIPADLAALQSPGIHPRIQLETRHGTAGTHQIHPS